MLRAALTGMIRFYRKAISPWTPAACRFQPTCSAYALEAVERHGALRGSALAARRILRCHPWGGSGYDPVPDAAVRAVAGGADAEGPGRTEEDGGAHAPPQGARETEATNA